MRDVGKKCFAEQEAQTGDERDLLPEYLTQTLQFARAFDHEKLPPGARAIKVHYIIMQQ